MKGGISKKHIKLLHNLLRGAGVILISLLSVYCYFHFGLVAGIMILLLPFCIAYIVIIYHKPQFTAYVLLGLCFFNYFISRYLLRGGMPAGIFFDIALVGGYAIMLLKGVSSKIEWVKLSDAPNLVLIIWLLYCLLSLANMESPGFDAWFLCVRVHLYMVLSIPLLCLLLDVKLLRMMLILWGIFSIIFSLKGYAQLNIGWDFADRAFLDIYYPTHLIRGKLRVFSFSSDAGQFGVQQAHAAVIGAILFFSEKKRKLRLLFLLMSLTGLYGMFVSGTRGAIFVVLVGAVAYTFLIRRTKLMIQSAIFAGGFYFLMAFTNIGQNVYEFQRMRTAFKPEKDESYLVRKRNQAKLKVYLASRPFGGGLGSMMYGPSGSVLASTPYDSGYVLTWGDQGIVGLCMYIGMILFFLFKGAITVWYKIKNEWLRNVVIAMMAGLFGVAVANYGNPVMLQFPTCILYNLTIATIYAAPRMDKYLKEREQKVTEPVLSKSTRLHKYRVT